MNQDTSLSGISVVIPVYNEEENVPLLYAEVNEVMRGMNETYEVIFVDDGSSDRTVEVLMESAGQDPSVRIIEFRRNFGQTAAMAAGFEHTRYDIVAVLDGDLQNDPREIPRMVKLLRQGNDLVAGWRRDRQDDFLSRKLPSMIANSIISRLTKVQLHDYGCTLKVMTGELARGIRLYGEMHRFIPALADEFGAKIVEVPVNHRARQFGTSKYGISRTLRVLLDLLAVKFLLGYAKRPIHFFGTMGAGLGGVGGLILAFLSVQKIFFGISMGSRPMLSLGVMLVLMGMQFLMFGLLAEVLSRTYHESQGKRTYAVRRYIEGGEKKVVPLAATAGV